jgi:hypothetical protein
VERVELVAPAVAAEVAAILGALPGLVGDAAASSAAARGAEAAGGADLCQFDIPSSDLPACQCMSTSVTSITSNVLLAIGPRPRREERLLHLDGQVHHDTHALPMGIT